MSALMIIVFDGAAKSKAGRAHLPNLRRLSTRLKATLRMRSLGHCERASVGQHGHNKIRRTAFGIWRGQLSFGTSKY